MKRLTILIGLLILAALINAEDKHFGKELTLDKKTEISTILASPEEFVGKKVQIEGTIVGVCEKRGCWIQVAAKDGYDKIRVKVNDGEIVFPMEAMGKTAVVEGEVYSITPKTTECTEEHKEGEAHECSQEKETSTIYQLKGLGAVIKM